MNVQDENRPNQASQSRGKVIGLVIAAVLVGLGWLLVQKLGSAARMQDCLMSGRTNCAPIDVPADRG